MSFFNFWLRAVLRNRSVPRSEYRMKPIHAHEITSQQIRSSTVPSFDTCAIMKLSFLPPHLKTLPAPFAIPPTHEFFAETVYFSPLQSVRFRKFSLLSFTHGVVAENPARPPPIYRALGKIFHRSIDTTAWAWSFTVFFRYNAWLLKLPSHSC